MTAVDSRAQTLVCSFIVPGQPVPKGRPRVVKGHAYTPARTIEAEKKIGQYLKAIYPHLRPVDGPVSVALTFWMKGAQTADWDNLAKLVCDALNGKVWLDDRQIVFATVRVYQRSNPATNIEVYPA